MRRTICGIIIILLSEMLTGQDSRFTQYFTLPTWLNPALSGQYDGQYRLAGVYRDQWRAALDQPISVFGFNADTRFDLFKNKNSSDKVSVALNLLNDRSRINDYNSNHISLTGAYHKILNPKKESILTGGATFGITQFGFDYNNITFGDQFNGVDGYTGSTAEPFPPNSLAVAEVALGLVYATRLTPSTKLYIGAAGHHINTPNKSFFNQIETIIFPYDKNDAYPARWSAYLMTAVDASKIDQVIPRLMLLHQGGVSEVNLGSTWRRKFYTSKNTALHTGLFLSIADHLESLHVNSVSGLIGFEISDLVLGMSYEYQLGPSNLTGTFGSFELSLTYLGKYIGEEDYCPKF